MVLHLEILKPIFFFPQHGHRCISLAPSAAVFLDFSYIVKRKHSSELNSSPDLHLHWLMKGMGVAVSVGLESGC